MGCVHSTDERYEAPRLDIIKTGQDVLAEDRSRSPAKAWLRSLNLEVYATAFHMAGYDSYEALARLNEHDLRMIERCSQVPIIPAHRMRILLASAELGQAVPQSTRSESPIPHLPALNESPGANAPLPPSSYLTLMASQDPDVQAMSALAAAIIEQRKENAARHKPTATSDPPAQVTPLQRNSSPTISQASVNQPQRRASHYDAETSTPLSMPIGVMMPAGQPLDLVAMQAKMRMTADEAVPQVSSPISTKVDDDAGTEQSEWNTTPTSLGPSDPASSNKQSPDTAAEANNSQPSSSANSPTGACRRSTSSASSLRITPPVFEHTERNTHTEQGDGMTTASISRRATAEQTGASFPGRYGSKGVSVAAAAPAVQPSVPETAAEPVPEVSPRGMIYTSYQRRSSGDSTAAGKLVRIPSNGTGAPRPPAAGSLQRDVSGVGGKAEKSGRVIDSGGGKNARIAGVSNGRVSDGGAGGRGGDSGVGARRSSGGGSSQLSRRISAGAVKV